MAGATRMLRARQELRLEPAGGRAPVLAGATPRTERLRDLGTRMVRRRADTRHGASTCYERDRPMRPLHFAALSPPEYAVRFGQQVNDSLRPFISYLNAAKQAAKAREARSWVRWEAVPLERPLKLEPLDSLLELTVEGHAYRVLGWDGPPPPVKLFVGEDFRPVVPLRVEPGAGGPLVVLPVKLDPGEQVHWQGIQCTLHPEPITLPGTLTALRADGATSCIRKRFVVGDSQRLVIEGRDEVTLTGPAGEPVTHRVLPPEHDATQLRTGKTVLPWSGDRTLAVGTPPDEPILTADNAVRWSWAESEARGRRKRGVWVQLLPPTEIDDQATMDPRAAYCEEGVRSVRTQKGGGERYEFKVYGSRRDSYRLELSELPSGPEIFLPANLGGFNQQLNAVYRLKDGPLPHHRGLLRLCEDPTQANWPPVIPEKIGEKDWFLLSNPNWDGTGEQREFVAKALGTQDIAFLEGPPGSGKTHAICELVLQLITRNKRVLLCSTTHVAVDNVLERLAGDFPQVEAVRIGRADRIDPRVVACQLEERVDRLFERWRADPAFTGTTDDDLEAMAQGTVLATANLTCGTTTGILRHPYLSRMEEGPAGYLPVAPSWAHFDVLIVDEASKTTLQEFLVPAQLAHRWVIVGDVRQLPPFTEPKDLEASLAEVSEDERQGGMGRLPDAYQRACLLFAELEKDEAGAGRVRWLIDEPLEVLNAFVAEVLARADIDGGGPCVVRIIETASTPCDLALSDLAAGKEGALKLLAAHWVLVPTALLPTVERFLPPDLVRLRDVDDLPAFAYRHAHWAQVRGKLDPPVRVRRGTAHANVASLHEALTAFLREQSWAKQIAWRLGRVHQLGNAKSARDRGARQEEIERLLPVAPAVQWVAPAVDAIRDVGVRSVIEALRVPRTEHRVRRRSALTDAIPAAVWEERSKLLTRQHRMHPDISVFPRDQFYERAALLDANTLAGRDEKAGWTFLSDQPARRIWVDVSGHEERGANLEEVHAMRQVLEAWKSWSATNAKKDGKAWEVACLSFYNKQELAISEMLRGLTATRGQTRFELGNSRYSCATVDRFQGREADLVLLSFRNTRRPGHADSPNRLNVAITRARFQLILVGNRQYFANCPSDELAALASETQLARPFLRTRG